MIVKMLRASGRQARTRLAFGHPVTRHGTNRRWCLARHAFLVIQGLPFQLDAQDMRSVMTTAVVRPVFRACALNISVTPKLASTPVYLHGTSSKNGGFMKLISLATGFRKMGFLSS